MNALQTLVMIDISCIFENPQKNWKDMVGLKKRKAKLVIWRIEV